MVKGFVTDSLKLNNPVVGISGPANVQTGGSVSGPANVQTGSDLYRSSLERAAAFARPSFRPNINPGSSLSSVSSGAVSIGVAAHGFKAGSTDTVLSSRRVVGVSRLGKNSIKGVFRGGSSVQALKSKRLIDDYNRLSGNAGGVAADKQVYSGDAAREVIGNTYKTKSGYRGFSRTAKKAVQTGSSFSTGSKVSSGGEISVVSSYSTGGSFSAGSKISGQSNPQKNNAAVEKINKVWRKHRMKAARAIYKSGGSAVSAIFRFFQEITVKKTLPLVLAVFLPVLIVGPVFVPLMAGSSFFSGEFNLSSGGSLSTQSIASTLLEEKVYENDIVVPGIPTLLGNYISELSAYLHQQQRYYHEVRLYSSKAAGPVSPSVSGIASAFPKAADFVDSIKYIMAALIIVENDSHLYDFEFTGLSLDMFEKLISRAEVTKTEYCGQSSSYDTPLGESNVCSCGSTHSLSGCHASRHVIHEVYTCSLCCSGEDSVSGSSASASFSCSGSDYCMGHKTFEVYINFYGGGTLVNEYFTAPIKSLSNKSFLTGDEIALLANLQDGYDILQEILHEEGVVFGYGGDAGIAIGHSGNAGEAIARAALSLAHESRSRVNAASSWYGSATQAYLQAHQLVWPGDRHANSCCRGVTVSIKYSGADVNMSVAGGINNIITGWFLRPDTPWREVYVSHRGELLPGDILMKHNSPDGSMNHGIVYTGTELMNEYFPGYGDRGFNIAHASYHTRGLAIDNAVSESGYGRYRFFPGGCIRVFRCTTQELSTVYYDRPLPPANVVQCMGGCG